MSRFLFSFLLSLPGLNFCIRLLLLSATYIFRYPSKSISNGYANKFDVDPDVDKAPAKVVNV